MDDLHTVNRPRPPEDGPTDVPVCTSCGRRPRAPGRKRCETCRRHTQDYNARLREEGRCLKCRRPHDDATATCEACLREDRARRKRAAVTRGVCRACRRRRSLGRFKTCAYCRVENQRRRAKRIAAGLCERGCGAYALPGLKQCLGCREEKMRALDAHVQAAHANGCCVVHKDRPLDPKSRWYCGECRAARAAERRKLYADRKARRLCPKCGGIPAEGRVGCIRH